MKHHEGLSRSPEKHVEIKTCFHILLEAITTILISFPSLPLKAAMFKKLKKKKLKKSSNSPLFQLHGSRKTTLQPS